MYCLSNFCYLCLTNDKNLLNVSSLDNNKTTILDKLLYTIEDLVLVNSKDIKICKVCCHILRVSHEFKKRCIQNNNKFLGYIKKLTEHSNVYANTTVNVDVNFIPKPKNKSKIGSKKPVNIIDITSTDDENSSNDANSDIINTLIERQIIETFSESQNVTVPKNKSKIVNKKRVNVIDITGTDDEDFVTNNSLSDAKSNIIDTLIERQIKETLSKPQDLTEPKKKSKIGNKKRVNVIDITSTDDVGFAKSNIIDTLIERQIIESLSNPNTNAVQNTLSMVSEPSNLKATKIIETKINSLLKNYTEQIKQKIIEDNTSKILLNNVSSENTATQTSDLSDEKYLLFDPEDSNLELQPLFDDVIDAPLIVVKTEPLEPVPTVEVRNTLDVTAPEVVPTEKAPDFYTLSADNYVGDPTKINFSYMPTIPTVEKQNTLDVPAPTVLPTEKEPDFLPYSEDYFAHPGAKISFADYRNWLKRTKVKTVVVPLEQVAQCDVKPRAKKSQMELIHDINTKIQEIDNRIQPERNIIKTCLTSTIQENVVNQTSKQDTDLENLILESNTEYNAKKELLEKKRRLEQELQHKLDNQPLPTIKETIINDKISELITDPFVKPVETTVDFEQEIGSTKIINHPQIHPILTKLLKKTNQHDITSKLDADPTIVLQLEHCYTKIPGVTTTTDLNTKEKRKRKSLRFSARRKKAKTERENTANSANKKYMCHLCYVRFEDVHDLNIHVITKHDCKRLLKCEFCPRIYTNLSSLRRHCTMEHKLPCTFTDPETKDDYKRLFKCEYCPRIYTNLGSLRRHCTMEHKLPCSFTDPEEGNVNTSRNEESAARTRQQHEHNLKVSHSAAFYKCNLCSNVYSAFTSLQTHFMELHYMFCSENDFDKYSQISINELESLNSGSN